MGAFYEFICIFLLAFLLLYTFFIHNNNCFSWYWPTMVLYLNEYGNIYLFRLYVCNQSE